MGRDVSPHVFSHSNGEAIFFLFIQKCGILNTDSVAWCHRGYQQNEVNANCVHNVVQG